MPLWKRLWLLLSVIWVVVAGLNVATILALEEYEAVSKAAWPLFFMAAVPALGYVFAWGLARLRGEPSERR